jgi:hypothetical protein
VWLRKRCVQIKIKTTNLSSNNFSCSIILNNLYQKRILADIRCVRCKESNRVRHFMAGSGRFKVASSGRFFLGHHLQTINSEHNTLDATQKTNLKHFGHHLNQRSRQRFTQLCSISNNIIERDKTNTIHQQKTKILVFHRCICERHIEFDLLVTLQMHDNMWIGGVAYISESKTNCCFSKNKIGFYLATMVDRD